MQFVSAALAVVLLAEVAAGVLGPEANQIPQVLDLHRSNLAVVEPDWVIVGDSSAGAAISPPALDLATGGTSYDLWQATASMQVVERLLFEFGLDQVTPSAVIIGVTGRMFNGASSEEQMVRQGDLEETLPWQRIVAPSLATKLEALAADRSALVRYRFVLRKPSDWYRAVTIEQNVETDGRGHLTFPAAFSVLDPHEAHREAEREALAGYEPGQEEFDALERTIRRLDDLGVAVYVVELPVYEAAYHQLYPNGEADVTAFRSVLQDRLRGLPAQFVDMTSFGGADPSLFADENHLTSVASEQFTAVLAAALKSPT